MGTLDRVREESGIANDSMEARNTFFYCAVASLDLEKKKRQNYVRTRCGQKCAMQFHFIPFQSISLFHRFFSFRFMSVHPSIPYHSTFHFIAFHSCHSFRSMPFHSMPFCFTHIVSCLSNPFHCMKTHFIVYVSSFFSFRFVIFHLTSFIRSIRFMSFISFHACHSSPFHPIYFQSFHSNPFLFIRFMSCHVMSVMRASSFI